MSGNKNDAGKIKFTLIDIDSLSDLEGGMGEYTSIENAYFSLLLEKNSALAGNIFSLLHEEIYGTNEISLETLKDLATLYTYGANMHHEQSWREVEVDRFIDALGRHLIEGNGIDSESKIPHLHHALWNALTVYSLLG